MQQVEQVPSLDELRHEAELRRLRHRAEEEDNVWVAEHPERFDLLLEVLSRNHAPSELQALNEPSLSCCGDTKTTTGHKSCVRAKHTLEPNCPRD